MAMRTARTAEQALRLAVDGSRPQYVCQSCRLHAARPFSTSSHHAAEKPWMMRMRESLFGSEESREMEKSREEKQQKKIAEDNTKGPSAPLRKVFVPGAGPFEVARVIDPGSNKDYIPATTWKDLESMGSERWVKRQAQAAQGEIEYTAFAPKNQWASPKMPWRETLDKVVDEVLADALQSHPKPSTNILEWRNGQLQNPDVKFAIVKRMLQITGKRLPDATVSRVTTVEDLYNAYKTPEPLKKLHKSPELRSLKAEIPNVTVYSGRRRKSDQEQDIGRWKVIVQELEKRGLPVKGTTFPSGRTIA